MITPPLPKPYKRVKVVSGRTGYDEKGERVPTDYSIYMDPRGNVSFAIGLPPYLEMIMHDRDRNGRGYGIERDGAHLLVRADTAENALALATKAFVAYIDKWAMAHRSEVIVYGFTGIAPKYDERGGFTNRWYYKPPRTEYGGGAGSQVELTFSFERLWKVGDDYFREQSGGQLRYWNGQSGHEEMPYSPEVWDQLVRIRETLTTAIVMLGRLFDKKDVAQHLLAMNLPPLLDAPSADKPSPDDDEG